MSLLNLADELLLSIAGRYERQKERDLARETGYRVCEDEGEEETDGRRRKKRYGCLTRRQRLALLSKFFEDDRAPGPAPVKGPMLAPNPLGSVCWLLLLILSLH